MLDYFLDLLIDVLFTILVCATLILLGVTAPIWLIPYMIYKNRRRNE